MAETHYKKVGTDAK